MCTMTVTRVARTAGCPAVRATRVTVIVHMGAPAKRGGPPPRRSLLFAVDGGPEMEAAGVELPAAVVPWVLLHHAGDTVSLGPSERLERAPVPEASAPTEARTRSAPLVGTRAVHFA
eukprot:Transcript_24210.p3 GENE.Transcript_24210~~Transcript_24210.p3  ORF type:complete len:117 (+),score=33.87 Transcript_24210:333-683(+)